MRFMSDINFQNFEDYECDDYEARERRKSRNDSKTLAIKIILAVLCFLLFSEAIIYLFIVPCLNPVKVSWRGLSGYTEAEMNGVIQSVSKKNWMNFSRNEVSSLISTVPGIESVKVVKRFPDRVVLTVKERVPVAMVCVNQGGRTMPVQVDRNGILFPSKSPTVAMSLPLISGIPVEHIPEGMRLPAKYRGLIDQISVLRDLPQNYFAGISEIHVVPKEYGNYELVLFPLHSRTKVFVDRQLNEETLKYMMVTIDVVNTLEKDVSLIDLRYGSVVYYNRQNERGDGLD